MSYSKRIRKIAKTAHEELEKEFGRCWLASHLIDGDFIWPENWEGIDRPITEAEAEEAIDCLERSGRIVKDVIDIHKDEESGFYYVARYYPNTVNDIRKYKKSRQYREWLGWKKYGRTPSWMKSYRVCAHINPRPKPECIKTAMPKTCPICKADLTKTVCEHTWQQMLMKMWE